MHDEGVGGQLRPSLLLTEVLSRVLLSLPPGEAPPLNKEAIQICCEVCKRSVVPVYIAVASAQSGNLNSKNKIGMSDISRFTRFTKRRIPLLDYTASFNFAQYF